MAKFWTNDKIELLITSVQQYDQLYVVKSKGYSNLPILINCWEKVAELVGTTTEKCKHKWKTLRDTYKKKRDEQSGQSGDGAIVVPKWEWFPLLSFLESHVKGRKSRSNVDSPISDANDSSEIVDVEKTDAEIIEAEAEEKPEEKPTATRKRRMTTADVKSSEQLKKKLIESLETDRNSDISFGSYIGNSISELSDTSKIGARSEISNVLAKYQLLDRSPQPLQFAQFQPYAPVCHPNYFASNSTQLPHYSQSVSPARHYVSSPRYRDRVQKTPVKEPQLLNPFSYDPDMNE